MLTDKTILVLEDEPIIGFALEDMLLECGCAVVLLATRLDEAEAIVASTPLDAAILDVNIHGDRSYCVADALARRKVPYVFATGYGETEHPPQHRNAITMLKPYTVDDIQSALRLALDRS